jgi:uncharacterized membrane protein YkoI
MPSSIKITKPNTGKLSVHADNKLKKLFSKIEIDKNGKEMIKMPHQWSINGEYPVIIP